MPIDDSFTKPGAVPFQWEIRPGVPKVQQQPPFSLPLSSEQRQEPTNHPCPSPVAEQQKLKPPPSSLGSFSPSPELRNRSFQSSPRNRSDRYHSGRPGLARPEVVASSGCFPSPLLKRMHSNQRAKGKSEPGRSYPIWELEPFSLSTRKTLSDSPSSSSASSNRSSPHPTSDAEWAGFGLF